MKIISKKQKIDELEKKLQKCEVKLAKKMKLRGQIERTRFGDSFEDQIRDDTNVLIAHINSIKEELLLLKS